jgi:hypothetical protein
MWAQLERQPYQRGTLGLDRRMDRAFANQAIGANEIGPDIDFHLLSGHGFFLEWERASARWWPEFTLSHGQQERRGDMLLSIFCSNNIIAALRYLQSDK